MVTKSTDKARKVKENEEGKAQKGGRAKTLNLKRETVRDLSKQEQRDVKGASLTRYQGTRITGNCTNYQTCTC